MMNTFLFPLVNWVMGTVLIGIFALICIVTVAVIYNLSQGKSAEKQIEE